MEAHNEKGLHFFTLTLKYPKHMQALACYVRFINRLELYGMNFELMMVKGEGDYFIVVSSTNAHIMAQAELLDWGDAEVVQDTPDDLELVMGRKLAAFESGMN